MDNCVYFDLMWVEHKNALASDSFILSDPWSHSYLDVDPINVQVAAPPSSSGPQSTPQSRKKMRGLSVPQTIYTTDFYFLLKAFLSLAMYLGKLLGLSEHQFSPSVNGHNYVCFAG